ncbi:hypothetical protein ElyMa_003479700 [Elysia marginata]|uniref:Uncharacterized protein n=1 Tax=Elysia marginata TaxID=1093978 RepID=A0AAV4EBL8_9GAST|nr:hypothetical protein ElyMa_003479700 [Elysia marginata]
MSSRWVLNNRPHPKGAKQVRSIVLHMALPQLISVKILRISSVSTQPSFCNCSRSSTTGVLGTYFENTKNAPKSESHPTANSTITMSTTTTATSTASETSCNKNNNNSSSSAIATSNTTIISRRSMRTSIGGIVCGTSRYPCEVGSWSQQPRCGHASESCYCPSVHAIEQFV